MLGSQSKLGISQHPIVHMAFYTGSRSQNNRKAFLTIIKSGLLEEKNTVLVFD